MSRLSPSMMKIGLICESVIFISKESIPMKQFCKRSLAVLLAVLILFGTCEAGVAYAVDEIDRRSIRRSRSS